MKVAKELSEQIQAHINEYLSGPDSHGLSEVVRRINALPLYLDIGGALLISPNGKLFEVSSDASEPKRVSETAAWGLTALVVGSEKYPELKALLPRREATALDCVVCDGTGKIVGGESVQLVCGDCSGLGWRAT